MKIFTLNPTKKKKKFVFFHFTEMESLLWKIFRTRRRRKKKEKLSREILQWESKRKIFSFLTKRIFNPEKFKFFRVFTFFPIHSDFSFRFIFLAAVQNSLLVSLLDFFLARCMCNLMLQFEMREQGLLYLLLLSAWLEELWSTMN